MNCTALLHVKTKAVTLIQEEGTEDSRENLCFCKKNTKCFYFSLLLRCCFKCPDVGRREQRDILILFVQI